MQMLCTGPVHYQILRWVQSFKYDVLGEEVTVVVTRIQGSREQRKGTIETRGDIVVWLDIIQRHVALYPLSAGQADWILVGS